MLLNCLSIDLENPDVSIKDLFLCSEKDNLEMPHSTEHGRMRNSGLGYQYDVKFPFPPRAPMSGQFSFANSRG